MKRFFFRTPLGRDFKLTGMEQNHLANVVRSRAGEEIIVCCGDEFDYKYQIVDIKKHETALKFIEKAPNLCNPCTDLTVFLALIKPDCLSIAVQKLNEIGVTDLVLFNAEYCNVPKVNLEKLSIMAEQSCKQCGRSIPMRVKQSRDIYTDLKSFDAIYLADENQKTNPIKPNKTQGKTAVIIGPEGGFSAKEHEIWCNMSNILHIGLGSRILRAETASIVAATLILKNMGEI